MYNNLTDSELINLTPTTELEAELIKRLDGSTEQDWDALHEQIEHYATQAREWEDVAERFRSALGKVATEIHRCADFGEIHITPEFRQRCDEVVHAMDEYVNYEYPKGAEPKNNSSSFRCGGEA